MENFKAKYEKYSLVELEREEERKRGEYAELADSCAKEGLSYTHFCEKARDIKESLYFIGKYIRLRKEPTVEYGKEWNGDTYEFDKFKKLCFESYLSDGDGYGRYATANSISDISVYPTDILEGMYRTDFTHVIWFGK